ncbi:PAS domain-containing protein, partial [Myxococcota bacterium]|nr:PAS domain-containing protein [Myxococcota bacterium]
TEAELDLHRASSEQLSTLETELHYTKENLQATIEELETSNEELQAANEELVASNEELQSTNEELQSVNEELYTVNGEYQKKIVELTELTADMDNLLASTEVGTVFLDHDLCVRKFTPRTADIFSLLPQDIGRRIEIFAASIGQERLLDDLVRVRDTGQVIEREVQDRLGHWFYLRVLPYRTKGEIRGVVLTMIDIQSLKAAEHALFAERYLLESVMETLPDPIYFKDAQGKYIRINSAMAKRLDLPHPSAAIGRDAADFLAPASVQRELAEEREVLRTGSGRANSEELHEGKEGQPRWLMTTRMPLLDRDGKVVGTFGVSRDITERREAEEKGREAVRRRDQFLAMLSHELRNPLGAITSASYILQEGRIDGAAQPRAIATIQRQASHMARLLDDLLDVSRVTQNKIELVRRPIDLRIVLQDAVEVARARFQERGSLILPELGDRPLWVNGDAARLQQVHVNLLNNACKFSRPGSRVWITAAELGADVVVRVRDEGIGIAPDMLDKVFELFVQCESPIDRQEAGLGVGLTLVRALVEMHGGSVVAASAGAGTGSELTVRLPRSIASNDRTRHLDVRLDGRGNEVVLVEDNDDSRDMLQLILQSLGFEVHTASNGGAAIELIRAIRPAVAFVDIGLPIADGYQVATSIRALRELDDVTLVALTGYGQPADRERALDAGFDDHMVKPISVDRLVKFFSAADVPATARA